MGDYELLHIELIYDYSNDHGGQNAVQEQEKGNARGAIPTVSSFTMTMKMILCCVYHGFTRRVGADPGITIIVLHSIEQL